MNKGIAMLLAVFLVSFLAVGMASALPTVRELKIDGNVFESGDQLLVNRGDDLRIRVRLTAEDGDEKNIEVSAEILGYEYSHSEPLYDRVPLFDLSDGDTVFKDLRISLPSKLERDYYDLRVTVGTRTGPAFEGLYRLHIRGVRHELAIRDVVFNPGTSVESGRALLATVRVNNIGDRDQENVKVTVRIPELGLSASDYIDEIRAGASRSSEELYMRIPECVEPKNYEVKITVEYDEGYRTATAEKMLKVTGDVCVDPVDDIYKTIITIGPEKQKVVQGSSAMYPVTITNAGTRSRVYVIGVQGTKDWATVEMTPGNLVVVGAGESKAVYLTLHAKDDARPGENVFVVSVSSEDKVLKEIILKADVTEKDEPVIGIVDLRRMLEIGVIVLVILLVILGLIIGFSKLREKEESDEEAEKGETYY